MGDVGDKSPLFLMINIALRENFSIVCIGKNRTIVYVSKTVHLHANVHIFFRVSNGRVTEFSYLNHIA